ncbi:MAG: phosphodiester glycosidase family protein [Bacteroidetes bacterium]|nr:phosphodiester glycosidase family protein [Bacteroidota bacterium]
MRFKKTSLFFSLLLFVAALRAQVKWTNMDTAFGKLPNGFHVFKSTDSLDGKPFIAWYAAADLNDKHLHFSVDTSKGRRLKPIQFYERGNNPLLVVNACFFSYETNKSLNAVIKDGKLVAFNTHSIPLKGKDTFTYWHPLGSAIGISKKRKADVAWLVTDSTKHFAYASQSVMDAFKDSSWSVDFNSIISAKAAHNLPYDGHIDLHKLKPPFHQWRMQAAVGGGPVLLQNGQINITNNEEKRFAGKAIADKHPRTCMGYTADGKLIIMVIQGRFPGIAEGATLQQEARLLQSLGCVEALNLDGGGSSCMLIKGKETIKPSDKEGARAAPVVFVIKATK